MGKHGKQHHRQRRHLSNDAIDELPSSAYDVASPNNGAGADNLDAAATPPEDEPDEVPLHQSSSPPSKFRLYQLSVQSPKGDVSYLLKFFLTYVSGRAPLHLQEDFCGTALLSTEWCRGDPRRTAVGIDLDLEALDWCLENNVNKFGADEFWRFLLFHGNVLKPMEACLVKPRSNSSTNGSVVEDNADTIYRRGFAMKEVALPERDIICAFNYSCCCLHTRRELVLYFKHSLNALSKTGGLFVMDLYGGASSEHKLRLQRKFPGFTYIWEQEEFDIINRQTRISLHFDLGKKQVIRHAFTYHWRLWTLPEIRDCLAEAGFKSIHFWMKEMPNTDDTENAEEYTDSRDEKYVEQMRFQQRDAWNAYIVAVAG